MDAPVNKIKQRNTNKKTGDKPGEAAKVTPEQVCLVAFFGYFYIFKTY